MKFTGGISLNCGFPLMLADAVFEWDADERAELHGILRQASIHDEMAVQLSAGLCPLVLRYARVAHGVKPWEMRGWPDIENYQGAANPRHDLKVLAEIQGHLRAACRLADTLLPDYGGEAIAKARMPLPSEARDLLPGFRVYDDGRVDADFEIFPGDELDASFIDMALLDRRIERAAAILRESHPEGEQYRTRWWREQKEQLALEVIRLFEAAGGRATSIEGSPACRLWRLVAATALQDSAGEWFDYFTAARNAGSGPD